MENVDNSQELSLLELKGPRGVKLVHLNRMKKLLRNQIFVGWVQWDKCAIEIVLRLWRNIHRSLRSDIRFELVDGRHGI